MSNIKPGLKDRVSGAFRLLLRRGDDQMVCSFCGKDRWKVQSIVAGPGVAICGGCASIAYDFSYQAAYGQPPNGTRRIMISPTAEIGERIPMDGRGRIHELVAETATRQACELHSVSISLRPLPLGDHVAFDVIAPAETDVDQLRERLTADCRAAWLLPDQTKPA